MKTLSPTPAPSTTPLGRTGSRPAPGFRRAYAALLATALIALVPAGSGASEATDSKPPEVAAFSAGSCILFQGDSITDGNRGRSADPNHILGHGYVFIIAARYGAAFPELDLNFVNRGISGDAVSNLAARWQQDCISLHPDVLSILVGANDNLMGVPIADFERTYDTLLAKARAANPRVRLVLCAPFTLPVGAKKADFARWYAGIKGRQEVVAKLALKYQAALVRLQPVFDAACKKAPAEHWIWDGVHPTYSGHELIADEWIRTVREFWPKL